MQAASPDLVPAAGVSAARLAAQLHQAAVAWARTLAIGTARRDTTLEEAWFREIIAYANRLAALHLANWPAESRRHFLAQLGRETLRLQEQRRRRVSRGRQLTAPVNDPEPQFDQQYRSGLHSLRAGDGRLREVYLEFCRHTGLSSDVLVGSGQNLAAIIFYFVIFGLAAGGASAKGQHQRWVLRTARDCRVHLASVIRRLGSSEFVAAHPAAES